MNIDEEVELLLSAYTPEEIVVERSNDEDTSSFITTVHHHYMGDKVTFRVPASYPEATISSISVLCRDLSKTVAELLKVELLEQCKRSLGEPSLFNIISSYVNTRADVIDQYYHQTGTIMDPSGCGDCCKDTVFSIDPLSKSVLEIETEA